jgi:alkaline phosphatase D
LFANLYEDERFQYLLETSGIELLHGPMLSQVTDRSAQFWVRTVHETPIQVHISPNASMQNARVSPVVFTDAEQDYTARASIEGLAPDTRYHYQLSVNGELHPGQWVFTTMPAAGEPGQFSLGFGGGAGFTPQYERMWNTIATHPLRAFLLLGDNVYIDHPTLPDVNRYCYYRRQSRPEFRSFAATSSIFAIWDDHDFTTNDAGGGPAIDEPAWKRPVWNIFKNNWNNPYYGGGEELPGVWFDATIADVDFFFLDGRYYRTEPENEPDDLTMLGPDQKQWLFEKLTQSEATFKVIASPVPWAMGAKPGSDDPWQGYPEEREEIFDFLAEHEIEGVILISADRHRSDAWKIERDNGYTLYEFESSRISNIHYHGIMPEALFGYNKTPSFGVLHFDTTAEDPSVSYEIYNIDNELIHKMTVWRSQLQ